MLRKLSSWPFSLLLFCIYFSIPTPSLMAQDQVLATGWDLSTELDPILDPIPSTSPAQNAALQMSTLRQNLKQKYRKLDNYIDLMLLSLLTQKHVLAFGGPGGSKTDTAQNILSSVQGKTFSLQFSPATKEEVIRGVQNVEKLLTEAQIDFNTEQSLLQHTYAILDEIDKANPEVLAALLSILNERIAMLGSHKISGQLKTALITSNMTIHEFLEKFRATGDESTGKALLDRVSFKILISNRMPDAEDLFEIFMGSKEKLKATGEPFSPIDIAPLQEKIQKMQIPPTVFKLTYHLWMRLMKELEKAQLQQQSSDGHGCAARPAESLADMYPFTMSNQFTTRGAGLVPVVMKAAKALHEIHINPSVDLEQVPWELHDMWFSQAGMIMQGPGDFIYPFAWLGKESGAVLQALNLAMEQSQESLAGYEDAFEFDPRMLKMLQDLNFERQKFLEKMQEVLQEYANEWDSFEMPPAGVILSVPELLTKKLQVEKLIQSQREKEKITPATQGRSIPEVARQEALLQLQNLWNKALRAAEAVAGAGVDASADKSRTFDWEKTKREWEETERKKEEEKQLKEKKQAELTEQSKNEILVSTTTGYIFKKVIEPEIIAQLGEAYRDPDDLVWGEVEAAAGNMDYFQAKTFCAAKGPGYRLPTKEEAEKLIFYFGKIPPSDRTTYRPQILKGFATRYLVLDTINPANGNTYYLNTVYGTLSNDRDIYYPHALVLCVYQQPWT